MKRYYLRTVLLFMLTFTLTGCYTVIWNPSESDFPTKENANDLNGFYPDQYYGAYSDFYGYPWWYNITPPGFIGNNNPVDNDGTVIRNLGGRAQRTSTIWNILSVNPPARNSVTQTRNVSKNNTNTSTSTRTESSRSSQNSTNSRNDNGSRNKDTGRKR